MPIPNVSNDEMREALKELAQATYNHDQWAEGLYGTLICGLTPDERDLSEDAHRLCRFGQWYYQSGSALFEHHAGFAEIGVEHQRMHECVTHILQRFSRKQPIPIEDFERFVSALKRLRLEIATVQHEIQETLFNLDPLTGTPSRFAMLTKLREQQQFVRRGVHDCTIAMMDIDHFKEVNDTYGHVVGDHVLTGVAHLLMANMRPYDRVFRYGGEEFLICLSDTDLKTGHDVIDRLRAEIEVLAQNSDEKGAFTVTVSFGMALLDAELAVEQSIDRADKALYVAKEQGRNRVVDWNPSMNEGKE